MPRMRQALRLQNQLRRDTVLKTPNVIYQSHAAGFVLQTLQSYKTNT
jgi:hypothetical protein